MGAKMAPPAAAIDNLVYQSLRNARATAWVLLEAPSFSTMLLT
ncbi:hypothetical protein [Propionivibrio sp.]|nr:hypothetical protein [Propionivibrio sp.]